MGHSVRDVAPRKLFTSTGRLSILSVLRRVKHSTVHVTKGQKKGKKNRVGKTDRRERQQMDCSQWIRGRTKDLNFQESHVCTHTSKPVIKARDKVLFG